MLIANPFALMGPGNAGRGVVRDRQAFTER
jgi:hypothetical protein